VDDFQGDERDIIILSMVRTTSKARFLMNYHRINVAISRARRLLIIVGNRSALEPMLVPMDDDMGTEKGPGRKLPIYRNMISTIERKNGILTEDTITGGE
jgi:superfamily I DNA and/or RNA helicase